MRFIYFTDVHLDTGFDARKGFGMCLEAMLEHEPELLVNGGDLGITDEALRQYAEMMESVSAPVLLSHGNHEMCSGYLPRDRAGTVHSSTDAGGVHFVVLDVVRYFEPTPERTHNWHVLADDALIDWLAEDLSTVDTSTPVVLACHVPLSTTFPHRTGQTPVSKLTNGELPTNEIVGAERIIELLRPFDNVATLHGHDHENCRHDLDHMQILTTAAVAGNWWRSGLTSRGPHGREPQGYRVIDVDGDGTISNRYHAFIPGQDEEVELVRSPDGSRRFINVFDGSPSTQVEVEEIGTLTPIDPFAGSSHGLATHLWELPASSSGSVDVRVIFEDGRQCSGQLSERPWSDE